MTALALGPEWLQPDTIIQWLGPWALVGLALIVFAECGLLIGFFLPGDSLLFTAGLFVASGAIESPLWVVCPVLVVAAFVGNVLGYWIGRAAGPAVFDKPRSRCSSHSTSRGRRSSSTSTATGRSCSAGSCRSCARSSR